MRTGMGKLSVLGACVATGLLLVGMLYVGSRLTAAADDPLLAPAAGVRPPESRRDQLSGRNPMLNAFGDWLDADGDVAPADRATSWQSLLDADDVLSDVKEQNAEALQDLKRPIHLPRGNPPPQQGILVLPAAP